MDGWMMSESSKEFGVRIGSIVNTACTNFSVSLGHDVGLFDILAKDEEPRTSQQIADLAGLKERYVRELLGALVMARIVDIDNSGEKYYLPGHRAAHLTSDGELNSSLLLAASLPTLGGDVYKRVRECFKKDGPKGVPYDAYDDVMDKMSTWSGRYLREDLVTVYVTPYPELRNKLQNGITVLDIGCGQGVSTLTFGEAFPKSSFCGIDLLEKNLNVARDSKDHRKIRNVNFVAQDAANLPADWTSKFEFVFMHNTLHDQARPDKALSETYRVLTTGGICLIGDTMAHSNLKDNLEKMDGGKMAMRYSTSLLYCMPVSLNFDGGMGLGCCWGCEKAVEMIAAAGLELVTDSEVPNKAGMVYYCKKA